ncbi:protein of unknown function [Kyrpidia spormannii]|uniref:Uncharacterized protein n=1 Tax=Kyrpidia spormannii TaxID=2055160 RepID=A0ACA8Z6Q6_9BACL|nr:protein of unknown function [Kyrpidia spormannii]
MRGDSVNRGDEILRAGHFGSVSTWLSSLERVELREFNNIQNPTSSKDVGPACLYGITIWLDLNSIDEVESRSLCHEMHRRSNTSEKRGALGECPFPYVYYSLNVATFRRGDKGHRAVGWLCRCIKREYR